MTTYTITDPDAIALITKFADAYIKDGDAFDLGCAESEINAMLQKAHDILPGKKRRVVTNWQWWDVQTGNAKLPEKYHSVMLYADRVIHDDSGQFGPNNWVRSMFLIKLHGNCIFETDNTFYIMAGKGTRKSVDVKTILMFS